MGGAGLLSVSPRGVNFGFWSHLGCCGQTRIIIFSRKGLFEDSLSARRIINKLYIVSSFYLLDSCNQSLEWSFLGVKRRLGHA